MFIIEGCNAIRQMVCTAMYEAELFHRKWVNIISNSIRIIFDVCGIRSSKKAHLVD